MKALKIGDLRIALPIIQGGMGVGVSLSGLASAVANQGGVGVISATGIGMIEPYRNKYKKLSEANKRALKKEIQKTRQKSKGIIGVNIMLAATDFDDLLKTSLEEGIDIVFLSAGLPLRLNAALLKETSTKFIPKVSSARAAKIIFHHWMGKYNRIPDAVVVEGHLAGGHLGFKKNDLNNTKITLASLVKETINVMDTYEQKTGKEIPVIAAGGIYSGNDMFNIMNIGAKGVKMGTRFVTTKECDVSKEFKQNYLSCSKNDITIIDSPVGLPGRVITNDFVREIQQGVHKPVNCRWKCLKTCDYRNVQYCIADALLNAAKGNLDQGFSFAGESAYLANKIINVKETIDQIKDEYLGEKEYSILNEYLFKRTDRLFMHYQQLSK